MNHFGYSFIDDETNEEITLEYYTTEKAYCMCRTYVNRKLIETRRISEARYIAAYDSYMNY